MFNNSGFPRIGGAQHVGGHQKHVDPKRAFTVNWERLMANVGQVVGIRGVANIRIDNPALVTVNILYRGQPYKQAEQVKVMPDGKISAQWKVVPYKVGEFTFGLYDVEIQYGRNYSGKTISPLKIIPIGGDRNVSSFG